MAEESKACTVTQAMTAAKRGLEQIRLVVVGEVSEVNDKPGYKAAYFSIRDEDSTMPCQMWRDAYVASGVVLRAGMLVQITGNFSCYTAKGRMQFNARKLEVAGEGNLRVQVARIAEKLRVEGLMDPSHKRRSPALPSRIAVVTSPRGKAIRDVQRTLRRRYPLAELMVFGVPVEGEKAPQYMIEALQAAQAASPAPDVILLVRGGGTYEDLMPFNDEGLARAVAACCIPVVTGIGHEPDNSIADMVADRRCSTPTAAAEAVAPSMDELYQKVRNATNSLEAAMESRLTAAEHSLQRLADRPLWQDPHYLTGSYELSLDHLSEQLPRALPRALANDRATLALMSQRLNAAGPELVKSQGRAVEQLRDRLRRTGIQLTDKPGKDMALMAAKLDALSPLKTLSRGYSITYEADGRSVISSIEGHKPGDEITVRVEDGMFDCTVNNIERQGV